MELTIRDWMVIAGVLLIVAVLFDAWRRVRSDSYSRVKVKLANTEDEVTGSERDADLAWLKELPNGGARVVERGDLLRAAGLSQASAAGDMSLAGQIGQAPATAESPRETSSQAAETEVSDAPEDDLELVAGMNSNDSGGVTENLDWLDGIGAHEAEAPAAEESPGCLSRDVDPEVFMLNVVARSPQGFRGEDILHILLACDLRFGDMSFFHRHEFEAGRGAIQFSVANMMQPGVFDIDNMADFDTPGLVFFVTLPGPEDMIKAFDYMLETAQAVARNLGGDVLDESRSVMTKQTLEHCRQQIRDLERRMLAKTR
jgi:cell division protein ZipA